MESVDINSDSQNSNLPSENQTSSPLLSEDFPDITQAQFDSVYEEKALNLITFDQQQGFSVSEEAASLLRGIKERVAVIAVAGKYRTGKSFLLNRILLDKKDANGFGVGPTINPCTKGLWIWSKPIDIESRGGEPAFKVFIVDSEGIGAFNEDQNHDTRIFLLALLLSSYFVYNSMGTIDENALQNLSLIVNLSKSLQIKNTNSQSDSDPDEVAKYFPSFMWVVRDFALRLLDQYGNPINSKDYLENALKEQKGTSDNIEKKNRIRRLIMNFFKERDCYTMVRPTEEEKDLQNLQKMEDEKLRPEFMDQMVKLRERIFKRVKPKVLNGRFINGEMLLELCHAYTASINKGSVPCIESAWTYLCQNECQRAILSAIELYETKMVSGVFMNASKSECVDYEGLKRLNKVVREEALGYFREKAVGENLKEFEGKILEEIGKKYVAMKAKCLSIYEGKCLASIKQDLDKIEQKIRQDLYQSITDFNSELEILKKTYQTSTTSISYLHKDLVLKQITEKLIIKAYETISRKEKDQLTNQSRALKELVSSLETDIKQQRGEYEQERSQTQQKLYDLQNEIQQAKGLLKLTEEKYKLVETEKNKLEVQLEEKVKALTESKEKMEIHLTSQLKDYQAQYKIQEEQNIKLQSSLDKDSALLSQKIKFTEKENLILQQRIEDLTQENKNALDQLSRASESSKKVETQLREKEDERRKEIELLKVFYEKKLEEIRNSDTEVTQEKYKNWEKERQFFQDQLSFSQKQIEENKKMHEVLLQAINSRGQDKEQDNQMMQTNKMLSETISKIESKNQQLQGKLSEIKIYSRVFKHSQSMQCKFCTVFFPSEVFVDHVKSCNKDNRFSRSHFFQIPMSISIQQTSIREDPVDHRNYTEYQVQINFNSKTWTVHQKYKTFCSLHESLINQYPNIKFPQSSFQFAQKSINDFGSIKSKQTSGGGSGSSTMIEDRRKILQQYLQDLALIPAIKESQQLKQFLGIYEQFPEFCESFQQSSSQFITETISAKQAMSKNFKIFANQKIEKVQSKPFKHTEKEVIQIVEEDKYRPSNISLNKSKLNSRNRYSNVSSQPTPKQDDCNEVQSPSYKNFFHEPMNETNNIDDLSSIERGLIDEDQNIFEVKSVSGYYDESHLKQRREDVESPSKQIMEYIEMHGGRAGGNEEDEEEMRHLHHQSYQTLGGESSHFGNANDTYNRYDKRNLYQKNFDQEIVKHEQVPIKKSTSSSQLVYSPTTQKQHPSYHTSLFTDKTNQLKKSIHQTQSTHKENCIACTQKKLKEELKDQNYQLPNLCQSEHCPTALTQNTPGSGKKQVYKYQKSTIQHDSELRKSGVNQTQMQGQNSGISISNTFSLLDELVKKGGNKKSQTNSQHNSVRATRNAGESSQKSVQLKQGLKQQSVHQSDSTPREGSKGDNQMKSDKILQDLLIKDKATSIQGTYIKKTTPIKQMPMIPPSHPKSPYNNSNKSGMGNPMNQVSTSTTPDQIQKKISYNFEAMNAQQNNLSRSIAHGSITSDKKIFIKTGEKMRTQERQ